MAAKPSGARPDWIVRPGQLDRILDTLLGVRFAADDKWEYPQGWALTLTQHAQRELKRRDLAVELVINALRHAGDVLESYSPIGYAHWNYLLYFDHLGAPLHIVIALK